MKRDFARHLRQEATVSEQLLWNCLRKNRLLGFSFRRQYVIEPYIVDFCCLAKRLVIELDGSVHDHPERVQRDEARQLFLETSGFCVLRFTARDVERNLEGVLHMIASQLKATPHPNPPPQGGRGCRDVFF